MVRFDSYKGPTFNESGLIPIVPVSTSTDDNMERLQIPLRLSWAITIHKSQGLTLNKAIVELETTEKVAGLAYVALSRVRSINDLIIIPFSFECLSMIRKAANFVYRIKEEDRLAKLDEFTSQSFNTADCYTIYKIFVF